MIAETIADLLQNAYAEQLPTETGEEWKLVSVVGYNYNRQSTHRYVVQIDLFRNIAESINATKLLTIQEIEGIISALETSPDVQVAFVANMPIRIDENNTVSASMQMTVK